MPCELLSKWTHGSDVKLKKDVKGEVADEEIPAWITEGHVYWHFAGDVM